MPPLPLGDLPLTPLTFLTGAFLTGAFLATTFFGAAFFGAAFLAAALGAAFLGAAFLGAAFLLPPNISTDARAAGDVTTEAAGTTNALENATSEARRAKRMRAMTLAMLISEASRAHHKEIELKDHSGTIILAKAGEAKALTPRPSSRQDVGCASQVTVRLLALSLQPRGTCNGNLSLAA